MRWRGIRQHNPVSLGIAQQVKPGLYDRVTRIQIMRTCIGVNRVIDLIVAGLVEAAKVEPDFRDERVKSDRSRIRVKGIPILIDLVIEYPDRAPESGILSVSINGLLVRFVRFVVFLPAHECTTE